MNRSGYSPLHIRYWLLLAFLFAATPQTKAQEIDVEMLILRSTINCHDIVFGATRLIPQYHENRDSDTIPALLSFWEGRCGMPEPLMRYKVLRNIQQGVFHENQLPPRVLNYLYDYRDAAETTAAQYANYYFDFDAWDYVAMYPGYNDFTLALAGVLKDLPNLQPIEAFFVDFYTHDFEQAMVMLESGALEGSVLDSLYQLRDRPLRVQPTQGQYQPDALRGDAYEAAGQHRPESTPITVGRTRARQQPNLFEVPAFHWGASLGFWTPRGSLSTLGNHPQLGFLVGATQKRWLFGFDARLGFLNTPVEYQVIFDNEPYDTRSFTQIYLGGHAGLALLHQYPNALYLLLGMGYDGIDPIKHSHRSEEAFRGPDVIHSYNFNGGLSFKRVLESQHFIGFNIRFNLVDYKNKGGTDLSGNVITAGVTFGMFERR